MFRRRIFRGEMMSGCLDGQKPENGDNIKRGRKRRRSDNSGSNKLQLVSLDQVQEATGAPWTLDKRVLELILDILQRKDTCELFAEPVDPDEVEDYYKIIKEPMDFGTMRAKLHEDMYQNLQQFQRDVFLIFKNAMHFNSTSSVYFKQARALSDMAKKVFHALKTDPQKFESEFATTKRRSVRRIQCDDKDSGLGSLSKPGGDKRSNGEKRANGSLEGARSTYTPWTLSPPEEDANEPFLTMQVSKEEIDYSQSLMMFVKDLGPTAKRVARRKLQETLASYQTQTTQEQTWKLGHDDSKEEAPSMAATRRERKACRSFGKKIVLGVPAKGGSTRAARSAKATTSKAAARVPRSGADAAKGKGDENQAEVEMEKKKEIEAGAEKKKEMEVGAAKKKMNQLELSGLTMAAGNKEFCFDIAYLRSRLSEMTQLQGSQGGPKIQ